MMADPATLPFIDEHHILVSAPTPVVWRQLGAAIRHQPDLAGRVGAWLLGAEHLRASGDPLTPAATLPGFTASQVVPGRQLTLTGRHRFSDYALTFTLTDHQTRTRLSARTDARFPGLHGQLYRALVIDSSAHQILLTRLLRAIRKAAEASTP
jgi:hypothetical protein